MSELSFGSWGKDLPSKVSSFCLSAALSTLVTFQETGSVSNEDKAFELMKAAYDGGVNFFDNGEIMTVSMHSVILTLLVVPAGKVNGFA